MKYQKLLRRLIPALLLVVIVLLGISCSENKLSDRSIGIAYNLNGKGDQSYNDAAALALTPLKARGYAIAEYEPGSLAEFDKGLSRLARQAPKLIFCVGYLYADGITQIADRYPNTLFVLLDGEVKGKKNVLNISFRADEASALVGAAAAAATRSNQIAFIGGTDIPIIRQFGDGFERGAKQVRKDVTVRPYYIGTGGTAFTDPVKGHEVAMRAIASGADIVYHAAGASGNGVIAAAKERGILAIGVDIDQSNVAPDTVFTSALKRIDVAIMHVCDLWEANRLPKDGQLTMDLSNGGVGYAPIREIRNVNADSVNQAVETVRRSIVNDLNATKP